MELFLDFVRNAWEHHKVLTLLVAWVTISLSLCAAWIALLWTCQHVVARKERRREEENPPHHGIASFR